ncbi:MAG: insulinase family protein [Rikenellaceae bacterium]|nr:insulinase family protein [Rikenellaceae bacterium]
MISYEKHTLANGLTVIAHRDRSTPMAATNLIYKVGARDEDPGRTGFAHLFEHLMFSGSRNVPDFDTPVQLAGGENNAFTGNDYTDYYITLPGDNLETAFWLESDRMADLSFDPKGLEVQRKVVVEEFNQRYLNQPYGDLWLLLRPLAYKKHPYRWATIGRTPDHIAGATMAEVKAFYKRYYNPSNAILSVAGDLSPDRVFALAERWFGDIPAGERLVRHIPAEPVQSRARRQEVERDVPATVITIAFHMAARIDMDFYVCDVLSDLLSNGNSSRLFRRLVQDERLFTSVNAYLTGELDPGLLVVTGRLADGVSVKAGEEALWRELRRLQTEPVPARELNKVRNKYESGVIFGEINVMDKAMNLGFYELLGDLSLVNREVDLYRSVTADDVRYGAQEVFRETNSSTLIYRSKHETR